MGIYLGHDKIQFYDKNWLSKLEKLEKLLSVWKIRNLTIFGKSTIINTLAISKIHASILQNPDNDFFSKMFQKLYTTSFGIKEIELREIL